LFYDLKLSAMPPKQDGSPRVRSFQRDKYDLKNLKFLGDFMSALGLNTTTAGEKIGISQVSVYYWLKKDDAKLSTVEKLINACGYSLSIEFVDPEMEIIMEINRTKRLSFLSEALSVCDKEMIAKELGMGLTGIYYWLSHDDVNISYIYRIAELIGKKVKVTIRPL